MTRLIKKLIIRFDRDTNDDDEFVVIEETISTSETCQDYHKEILGKFHDKQELMINLKRKIKEIAR
jgi:hypothetical protein